MKFESMLPWAMVPTKHVPDVKGAREYRDHLRSGFTHVRAERQPEFCPPWVQGQTLGWRVHSPIDVELSPLVQQEIAKEPNAAEAAQVLGHSQVWVRGDAALAVSSTPWLNGHEFWHDGQRQSMFVPNGLGTVEWRLGWKVADSGGFGLLIIPAPDLHALGVEVGFLSVRSIERLDSKGFSVAVRPANAIKISRGQEIARLIPISAEALAL